MKKTKILVFVLLVALCLSCFAACNKTPKELVDARDYLYNQYKEFDGKATPADFNRVGAVMINGTKYPIEWTVEVKTEGQSESVKVVKNEDGTVTVDVDEKAAVEISYDLVATISNAKGKTITVTFHHTVPQWRELTWAEYMATEKGQAVVIKGKVASISSKSTGDKYNLMYIYDNDGGYYVYSLTEDPLTTYPNLALGMTVQVTGEKDIFKGTHEVKNATFTVIDAESTIEFADITDIFAATDDMKSESLTKKAYMPVTIKNVIIGDIDEANSYYYFTIGASKSYLRISSSDNMLSEAETKAFKDGFAALKGKYATVKGLATVYSGSFYIQVITADAAVEQAAPEKDPAGQIADVKGRLAIDTKINGSGRTFTLPTQDTVYTSVNIAWAASSEVAKIEDGKVTYTFTEDGTVKLTATLTHATDATVSDTKEFEVTLSVGTPVTVAEFLQKAVSEDEIYILTGFIVADAEDSKAGSFVFADATGAVFSYNKFDVAVGDKVKIVATRAANAGLPQLGTISVTKLDKAEGESYTYPEATELAAADIDLSALNEAKMGEMDGTFYKITGTILYKNDKGQFNAGTAGATAGEYNQLLNVYTASSLVDENLLGKEVVIYGYVRGFKTGKYLTIQIVKIEAKPQKTDAEKVAEAKEALTLDVTTTGVSFKLPVAGLNDAVITWASDNEAVISINGEDATVISPAAETVVKLTATITIGEASDTKEFNVTVTVTIPEFDVTVTQPEVGGTLEVKNGEAAFEGGKVQQGTKLTISATLAPNYEIVAIKVNGEALTAVEGVYSVTVTEAIEITVELKEIKFATVTFGEVENGTLTVKDGTADVATGASVKVGTVLTITATANSGYKVSAVKVNGTAITGNTYIVLDTDTAVEITVETAVYTQTDIVNDAYKLAEGEELGVFTLTGVIVSVDTAYDSGFKNVTVTIVVEGLTDKPIQCFRLKGEGADVIAVNDTITVTGKIKNHFGKVEFDSGCTFTDRVIGNSTISVAENSSDKATVTFENTSGQNGTNVNFTVAVSEGYELVSVKVNNKEVEAVEGTYTATFNGNLSVLVETKEAGAVDPVVVATFNLGNDKTGATIEHFDGSSKTEYTETSGDYTLTLSSMTNVYTGANDAKGNGALKLGTGKKTGGFSFTIAENVEYVVIYVAQYKAKGSSVTINGTAYTLDKASDNGEYTAIKVAVPADKTITFASGTSGDKRCMIDKIEFYA